MELILDPYDSEYLYQFSFDELIEKVPYNSTDEKQRVMCYRYPIIFPTLSRHLKIKYSAASKTEIQIQATRLGLSKIQHDPRIKEIEKIFNTVNSQYDDLRKLDRIQTKVPYHFSTLESRNSRLNISLIDWVFNSIDDISVEIGLTESELSIAAFFIGIQGSQRLDHTASKHVTAEVERFWLFVDERLNELKNASA